jgi:hypothetical protein
MAITSVGWNATLLGQSVNAAKGQFDALQLQLASGKKSTTYAGMGLNEGFAIGARAQLAGIGAFTDTMTKVTTVTQSMNTALQSIVTIGRTVQSAAASDLQAPTSSGRSLAQQTTAAQLSSMLGILNTQVGDRFIFSGSATNTPSVASFSDIMDGTNGAAGVRQVVAERRQADLGASGMGRLVVGSPAAGTVSLGEDVAGSPFGMKLSAVTSGTTGATVSGPSGSPAAISVAFAGVPTEGDAITFTFAMPDGSTEERTLAATSSSPPPTGSFTIGATAADSAANLQAALTTQVSQLVNTALVAASAIRGGQDFFSDPPQRVSGSPATATALVAGSATDTVKWYTGEAGSGAARASVSARVDQSVVVQFGARANEEAIRNQLATMAAFAAVMTPANDPNAAAQLSALSRRVGSNLLTPTGQRVTDIQGELANVQLVMKDAASRQTAAKSMLENVVDQAESISPNDVAAQLLSLQTSLQASYQTTAMLAQLSLTRFL